MKTLPLCLLWFVCVAVGRSIEEVFYWAMFSRQIFHAVLCSAVWRLTGDSSYQARYMSYAGDRPGLELTMNIREVSQLTVPAEGPQDGFHN